MWKKIWQAILSLFRRRKGKQEEAYADDFPATEVCPSDNEAESIISRTILLTSTLRTHRKWQPGTKYMKVAGFAEAYLFFIRLCARPDMPLHRKGGHLYYTATLPYKCGSVELTDKSGMNRKTVAVMRLDIPALPEMREIRFVKK